jgi:arginine repressor
MFFRFKSSVQNGVTYEYLQITESFRKEGKPRQRIVANLGRRDRLEAEGKIDSLVESLAKFSQKYRALKALSLEARTAKLWGPLLIFGRLWEEQGLPEIFGRLAEGRKFGFDLERVAFAMTLQRLISPGSDLQGSGWAQTVEGLPEIALQHLYRTNGFLAEVRAELEKALFARDRDLFSQELDVVFLDTTSVAIHRDEETEWRKRGYSRDHRPDLPQLVLSVAVDKKGWPVSWEVFPGNTADPTAFEAMITKMRTRFKIGRVVVVANRGMMGKKSLELLTEGETPYDYILGCRMRRQKEIGTEVLARGGRYQEVAENLKVKEVRVGDHRYVICLNEEEERKDEAARAAILDHLREKLSGGAKSLVGNKGYARYLKVMKDSMRIDEDKVLAESRFDGKYVLRTNTDLPTAEVAQTYKSLWRVERAFRETKSTLEMRPIFHHRDDTSIGHIVAGFLALRLEVDLQRRLDEHKVEVSWPTLMRDLSQVQAVHLQADGRSYLLRTDLQGTAHQAFQAAGVRPPSSVTICE